MSKVDLKEGDQIFRLQLLALVPIFLLQFTYGMNTGFPAILTPQLAEEKKGEASEAEQFTITADEESWIVSLDNLATPLVCVASGCLQQEGTKFRKKYLCFDLRSVSPIQRFGLRLPPLSSMFQVIGPKVVLLASCFPYLLAWVTCARATGVHQLYLSRVLVGFSHALVSTTVYSVEIASKEMRGTFSLWESVLR